jgi:hypothetical protein
MKVARHKKLTQSIPAPEHELNHELKIQRIQCYDAQLESAGCKLFSFSDPADAHLDNMCAVGRVVVGVASTALLQRGAKPDARTNKVRELELSPTRNVRYRQRTGCRSHT